MYRRQPFLTTGQAARQLGVSPKALRLYEERHLLTPGRTRAGWRVYGPADIAIAKDIISLRELGLGLNEIATLLGSDASSSADALSRHQSRLESRMRDLRAAIQGVRNARNRHRDCATDDQAAGKISFDLPWPWGGERFSLPDPSPLTYITGPLGSGKTRLAMRLAEVLPGGQFLGPDRLDRDGRPFATRPDDDIGLRAECDRILRCLEENGATISSDLTVLIAAIHCDEAPLIIDMVEQGLDHLTQLALSRHLRNRSAPARPLLLMTRSSAILDLSLAESGETIIYCPANHSLPMIVHPDPHCPGYEVVGTCLASPEVRARTAGVIAAWKVAHDDSRETIS